MERDNFGRTQPGALTGSPPPQPCHLGRWPARRPSASSGRPCPRLNSFAEVLHRAWPCILASVTTRGRLGAQPRIARPTLPLPAFQPHSGFTFSPSFLSSFFVVVANLGFLSSLLPFFFPSLFLFSFNGRRQGRGALESFRITSWCSCYGRPAVGTVRRVSPVSPSGPRVSP